jgi:ATP-dependent DNA ligase
MSRVVSRRLQNAVRRERPSATAADPLPSFIEPQLSLLRKEAPSGNHWVHELKYDGYRVHARIDRCGVQLLTRSGLDWSHRHRATADALGRLPTGRAYLDGELCAVRPDGSTSFSAMQAATDQQSSIGLVFFLFDLLHLDGRDLRAKSLLERKSLLASILEGADAQLRYSEHLTGSAPAIRRQACGLGAEGLISKQIDKPYAPGNRSI